MKKAGPTLLAYRSGSVLLPYSRFDTAILEGFRSNVPLKCVLSEPRSVEANRLYWSVLKAVCDATGRWSDSRALHKALKLHFGIVEIIAGIDGEAKIIEGSTDFASMGEDEARTYMNDVYNLISTEICPGITVEELLALAKASIGPGLEGK